ncbi:MAG: TetR/AcrR family transcriptional regulator [Planctomycetota bacterium]
MTKRMSGSERRDQLLRVAAELFAEHGYARTTTAELARAAGVTEPIIYRHFQSKHDLFVALIRATGERTIELWSEALEGAASTEERVSRLLGSNVMVNDEQGRAAYRVIIQGVTEAGHPETRAAIEEHFNTLHAFLSKEIAAGQAEHRIWTRFDADLIAWVLIDVALGYGLLEALRVRGHGHAAGESVQSVVRRLLLPRVGGGTDRPTR